MNKHSYYLSILLCFTVRCSVCQVMEVNLKGVANSDILIEYAPVSQFYSLDEPFSKTITAVDGRFRYQFDTQEPVMVMAFPKIGVYPRPGDVPLHVPQKYMELLISPGEEIQVEGILHSDYLEYATTGSNFNEQYASLRNSYIRKSAQAVPIELAIIETMTHGNDHSKLEELFAARKEIQQTIRSLQSDFIQAKPKEDLSAYLLCKQSLDTLGRYANHLAPAVRRGIFSPMLEARLFEFARYTRAKEAKDKIAVGEIAPQFSLKNIKGDLFELPVNSDKFLVLDFWGSWCGPCIAELPKMKSYYEQNKELVEFIGIACNDTKKNWKKAVEAYELPWIQVINEKQRIEHDASLIYGIMAYPTKIIIDPSGKIQAIFQGETEDFYTKLTHLLQTNKL